MTYIYFSGEDDLSEALAMRCVRYILPNFEFVNIRPRQGGIEGVRDKLQSYVAMALRDPLMVMIDQDKASCAPTRRQKFMDSAGVKSLPKNMVFSVVTQEAESWVLGDREGLARFLSAPTHQIPENPEILLDPKAEIIAIASKGGKFREKICPKPNTSARVGPDYNNVLCDFVLNHWHLPIAADKCPTLKRTLRRLEELKG